MKSPYGFRQMDRRIWFLAVTRFIRSFGRGSTFIFLPLVFIISYNQGFLETGVLLGFATLLQSIVQYYSGKWTDLIGRRKILVYTQIPNVLFYFMLFV
ncbi:MAG: MFS transporter, partial [Candidatus Thermoplasmatota archaeon]|nr:MFS transporter [Candidatus Thermoplasmatota archaeon]